MGKNSFLAISRTAKTPDDDDEWHPDIVYLRFLLLDRTKIGTEDSEENEGLTHETRQIHERVWVNSNCSLNFSVFSRLPRRSGAKAGV